MKNFLGNFFLRKSRPLPVVVGELAVADDVNDDDDAEHDVDVEYFAEEPFWDKMIFKLELSSL